MTEVRVGRAELPGGYDRFNDRSRSRGEVLERRGDYGRAGLKEEDRRIRRDEKTEGGEMNEMHSRQGQRDGGGYRDRESGGGDGYRDRGYGGGRGYDDRGRGGGRGGGAGYGGGGGFGGGSKVANVQEGQTSNLLSNHFRFKAINETGKIYIYNIEFGTLDNRELRHESLRSIDGELKRLYG
jgi:hypothetical protein